MTKYKIFKKIQLGNNFMLQGFTLVEMLMALLIVSVILSASLPVISTRQKAMAINYNQNKSFPIGGIIVWYHQQLPDSTWLECNGQPIPSGIEYENARRIFGTNLPNFQGLFLRAAGSQTLPSTMGSNYWKNVSFGTGEIGTIQGDSIRNITGGTREIIGTQSGSYSGVFYDIPTTTRGLNSNTSSGWYRHYFAFDASRVTPVSDEIRPVNIAVKYIAKVRY